MRALFLKELKQGQPLLVFAAAMGLLVILAYLAVGRFLLLYGSLEQPALAFAFGIVAAVMLPLFALFASSGILAKEAHADTLPLLFGLPLSRLRVWGAIALAALSLLALGSAIMLTITRAVLHSPFLSLALRAHLPDAICFALFILSVGLFCSSLARGVTAALASTILLAGAITGGASALVFYYGAPITGLPIFDLALWCLFASPALLLGSARAVTRGELLTGYRKWLFSVPLTLFALALTFVLVCVLARATTQYRRGSVAVVSTSGQWNGTKLLPLMTSGGGATFSLARGELLTEQMPYASTLAEVLKQLHGRFASYTRNYGVAFDLETGKELFTVRAPLVGPLQTNLNMGCSTDGRWVATLGPQQGLTWGRFEGKPMELCIYDTKTKKLVARNADIFDWEYWYSELSWSPSGEYLAVIRSGGSGDKKTLRIVNKNAQPLSKAPIILGAATWSPVDDVLYGIDANDALCQLSPEGKQTKVIWSPSPGTEKTDRWFNLSPDGQWLVMNESRDIPQPTAEYQPRGQTERTMRLVNLTTGESQVLWRSIMNRESMSGYGWSRDGGTLYALIGYTETPSFWRTNTRRYQLMRWQQGEQGLKPLGPEITTTHARLLVPPGADTVLVWTWRAAPQRVNERGEFTPSQHLAEELLAIDNEGQARRLQLLEDTQVKGWHGRELGFDQQGRLLYLAEPKTIIPEQDSSIYYSKVTALDLKTGKSETIYP